MMSEDHPYTELRAALHSAIPNIAFDCVWIRRVPAYAPNASARARSEKSRPWFIGWLFGRRSKVSELTDEFYGWLRRSSETEQHLEHPGAMLNAADADVIAGEAVSARAPGTSWFKAPGGEASFVHEAGSRGPEEGWIPVLAQTTEILSHRHTYRLVYRVYWAGTGSGERRPVGRIASRLSAIKPTGDRT
jgi:hypothetical protein